MVHYLLSWGDPNERLYDVAITFVAPADDPRLVLPAWRPGRYLIQNFAANVREWSAGAWKDGKSSWRVPARAGEEVTFRYRYYAGVLDAGSSFLDAEEAYFNGSNLFMMVEGLREDEHRLTIAAPAGWRIETQLVRDGEGTTFRARGYDHLIDSPTICAERMTRHTFLESGATIHLIFRGDEGIDTEQYIEPVRAMVRYQAELFGGLPFREYRFLYHVGAMWHGVEHEDSSSIMLERSALLGAKPGDDGYDHMLSITSHELFHVWNVKRILPARFLPYDYSTETPTRLLWVMEGMTSYYGELTLVRSGLWSEERYVAHLRKEIETLENLPARRHLSLAQASFDGWLSEPSRMHDHSNAWYSFYNKGQLVAMLLDLTIRRVSGGTKSLDDVLGILWSEYGARGVGLEEDALERAVARVADVGDFFARYVDGTDDLPYAELLRTVGVAFDSRAHSPAPALGAKVKAIDGALLVQNVTRGGAAMDASVLPGDELVALDGTRTNTASALASALDGAAGRESAELLIARWGVMKTLSLPLKADPRVTIELKIAGESDVRRAWLGERREG
ncbi:MAG TPA: PDZ domain-containing protein [Thermoanaerobaculia bacterium]|nr:PDZ domain-containing protein [Thermoanaerobaculia bacterium]